MKSSEYICKLAKSTTTQGSFEVGSRVIQYVTCKQATTQNSFEVRTRISRVIQDVTGKQVGVIPVTSSINETNLRLRVIDSDESDVSQGLGYDCDKDREYIPDAESDGDSSDDCTEPKRKRIKTTDIPTTSRSFPSENENQPVEGNAFGLPCNIVMESTVNRNNENNEADLTQFELPANATTSGEKEPTVKWCSNSFTDENRQQICKEYQDAHYDSQKEFILSRVHQCNTERRRIRNVVRQAEEKPEIKCIYVYTFLKEGNTTREQTKEGTRLPQTKQVSIGRKNKDSPRIVSGYGKPLLPKRYDRNVPRTNSVNQKNVRIVPKIE
ncbi:hypothetical protein PR048_032033 [Dryococelus australis]|uniref:Uncharacterized protein n=1 Tax=Dryococelus australis TaxID=614101 RepID=A0ABQ9G6Z4_9NEOP|nr:hypothetical protein PR048_032033 [Dryococelus australis]